MVAKRGPSHHSTVIIPSTNNTTSWYRTAKSFSRQRNYSSSGSTSRTSLVNNILSAWPSTMLTYPDPLISYNPLLLDDPELLVATGKRVLKLPNYLTSILGYVRPNERKREVNREFHERFPFIQITLTKLRSIKLVLVQIVQRPLHYFSTLKHEQLFLIFAVVCDKIEQKAMCFRLAGNQCQAKRRERR
ncbi:unnamed protein product [Trichobilharzia regenti]|nr:unnamed protein product [Trichobilharzia regenti]